VLSGEERVLLKWDRAPKEWEHVLSGEERVHSGPAASHGWIAASHGRIAASPIRPAALPVRRESASDREARARAPIHATLPGRSTTADRQARSGRTRMSSRPATTPARGHRRASKARRCLVSASPSPACAGTRTRCRLGRAGGPLE
jgi:hypothetical protein